MCLGADAQPFIGLIEAVHIDDAEAEGGGAGAIQAVRRHEGDIGRSRPSAFGASL